MMTTLYGNESVISLLKTLVSNGRFSHAYLFCGANGLGKKTFAKEFARSILCQEAERPCGHCSSCKKIESGSHPDFQIWDEDTKSGTLSVGFIRQLRADCSIMPNESDYKIYLIPNIERMNESAFNAFLKTLEEPPKHVIFLLTSEYPEMLADTIQSRVVPVRLTPLKEYQIAAFLRERFPDRTDSERNLAAELAEGNGGAAVQLLSNDNFEEEQKKIEKFCWALRSGNDYELLKIFSSFDRDKKAVDYFLDRVLHMLRLAIRTRNGVQKSNVSAVLELLKLSERQMLLLANFLEQSRGILSTNSNYQLTLFYFTAELCRIVHR